MDSLDVCFIISKYLKISLLSILTSFHCGQRTSSVGSLNCMKIVRWANLRSAMAKVPYLLGENEAATAAEVTVL